MGVQAINPTAQELKASRSKVQGYLYINSDLEANLEYMRPSKIHTHKKWENENRIML